MCLDFCKGCARTVPGFHITPPSSGPPIGLDSYAIWPMRGDWIRIEGASVEASTRQVSRIKSEGRHGFWIALKILENWTIIGSLCVERHEVDARCITAASRSSESPRPRNGKPVGTQGRKTSALHPARPDGSNGRRKEPSLSIAHGLAARHKRANRISRIPVRSSFCIRVASSDKWLSPRRLQN